MMRELSMKTVERALSEFNRGSWVATGSTSAWLSGQVMQLLCHYFSV
jgi:hypothetical protein